MFERMIHPPSEPPKFEHKFDSHEMFWTKHNEARLPPLPSHFHEPITLGEINEADFN
mgnify:CR=1 FL=1